MDKQSTTLIYGLIGYPVKHSLSKVIQEEAFKACNINAEYRLIPVKSEELKDFLLNNKGINDIDGQSISLKDLSGFNITIPHKVKTFEVARLVGNITVREDRDVFLSGAINTVKREEGSLSYRNTDITGFVQSLQEGLKFNCAGKSAIVFGCGGAGRAVATGLLQEGMNTKKIYMYDVNKEARGSAKKHFSRFDDVRDKLEFISEGEIPGKIKESDLLVNASPVGMKEGDGSIVDKNLLHDKLSVYDVVYNRETQLIKDAKSLKRPLKDGLAMLLYQGVAAFEFWMDNKVKAPIDEMRQALNEGVKRL